MVSPLWSAFRQNRFQSAWLFASSLHGGQYNCSSLQNTQSDTHIHAICLFMYYLPSRCLSILTLPIWAVLCQWLTVVLCDGPTSGTSGPHEKSASSFSRYRQELSLSVSLFFSNHFFSAHIPICESFSNSLLFSLLSTAHLPPSCKDFNSCFGFFSSISGAFLCSLMRSA